MQRLAQIIRVGNKRLQEMYTEQLHDFYSSPHIVRVAKSRDMRRVGQGEHMVTAKSGSDVHN
jgi:hypothetical protein